MFNVGCVFSHLGRNPSPSAPPPYRDPPAPPPGARGGGPIPTSPTQGRHAISPSRGHHPPHHGLPPHPPHSPTPPRSSSSSQHFPGGRPPHYSPPPHHRDMRGGGPKGASPGRAVAARVQGSPARNGGPQQISPSRGHSSPSRNPWKPQVGYIYNRIAPDIRQTDIFYEVRQLFSDFYEQLSRVILSGTGPTNFSLPGILQSV